MIHGITIYQPKGYDRDDRTSEPASSNESVDD